MNTEEKNGEIVNSLWSISCSSQEDYNYQTYFPNTPNHLGNVFRMWDHVLDSNAPDGNGYYMNHWMAQSNSNEWCRIIFDEEREFTKIMVKPANTDPDSQMYNNVNPPGVYGFYGINTDDSTTVFHQTSSDINWFGNHPNLTEYPLLMENVTNHRYKGFYFIINQMHDSNAYIQMGEIMLFLRKYNWNQSTQFLIPERSTSPSNNKS
jgi:hypothetical protein